MAKIEEKPTLKSTVNDLINDMNLKKKSTADSFDYDQAIDSLVKDLYDGKEFSYDSESDPEWQAAKQEYTKEADRTMRDVLAQGAARTGGIASTAAITAASEARDYTMSGLAEKKAQLRNEAYSRYQQENQAKLQILSVLDDLQDEERNEYLTLLETQDNIEKTERDEARAKVSSLMSMGILPSDALLASAGYDSEYAAGLKKNYFDSMDTAAMQKFLNEHGAKLTVDGVWGSGTEAAYKKYFGKSSGRQDYFGGSGGGGSLRTGNPVSDPTPKQKTTSNYDDAKNYLATTGLTMSASAKNDFINEAVESGELTKTEGQKLKQYIGNAR